MNYYGIPEFVSYTILVGIAVVLIRQDRGAHLRYWLAGWVIILLHAGIYMLLVPGAAVDILGRGLLALAGLAFMTAAYYWEAAVDRAQLLWQLARIGLPNIVFAVASTAYAELCPDGHARGPFMLLIAVGAVSAVWQAFDAVQTKRQSRALVALAVIVYGLQASLLYVYGVLMASQWLMCWTYMAVAFFFLRQINSLTIGTAFTALSFVLWGLVFPAYSLLQIYAPAASSHIESLVWNLPKFLTAASMILVLLEEKVARATQLATHDELTGLPNRRLYEDRFNVVLDRARRTKVQFAVMIIDLNRFKQVNDTLGHQAGDQLLKKVSERFRAALRRIDTVARTGGDEFTVLLEGIGSAQAASEVVDIIRKTLETPIMLAGTDIDVGASVGVAIYPEDGGSQTELHAVADARMYIDKGREYPRSPAAA